MIFLEVITFFLYKDFVKENHKLKSEYSLCRLFKSLKFIESPLFLIII